MKKEDVYKKVDSMLKRLEKESGERGDGHFPMKKDISFTDWKGKRLYIKLDLTDRFGTHRKYECGYIDMETGKYSSKVKPSYYYGVLSLTRPNYDKLKNDFMPLMSDDERQDIIKKMLMCYQEEENMAANKESRKPRKAVYIDGKFIYKEEYSGRKQEKSK